MAAESKPENSRVRKPLTQERLKELLQYDPETGIFVWKVKAARQIAIGAVAGGINPSDGYRYIRVDGYLYSAHRLALLYRDGQWPPAEVDHKNTVRDDNRLGNLRHASRTQNARNTRTPRTNTSGVKGVHWAKNERKWVAAIKVNRRNKTLGYFDDIEDARKTYAAAAEKHFGDFARSE